MSEDAFKATGVKVCVCESCTSKGGGLPLLQDLEEYCPLEIAVGPIPTLKDLCSKGPCLQVQPKGTKLSNGQYTWPQPVSFTGMKSFKLVEGVLKKDVGLKPSSVQQKVANFKYDARRSLKDKDSFLAIIQKAFKALGGESSACSQEPLAAAQLLVLRSSGVLAWDIKGAMLDASKAVELQSGSAAAHYALASGYEALKRWDDALSSCNAAIDSNVGQGARGFDRQGGNRMKERLQAEVAKKKAEEEVDTKKLEDEAAAKRRAIEEEEAKKKAMEEKRRNAEVKKKVEARKKAELEAKKKAQEEAEAEARRKAEEEEKRKKAEEEEEAARKLEEQRLKEEEEARVKAAEEARLRAEEEARAAEEASKRKADEEAQQQAEAEAKSNAEKDALPLQKQKASVRADTMEPMTLNRPGGFAGWFFQATCCRTSDRADDAAGDAPAQIV